MASKPPVGDIVHEASLPEARIHPRLHPIEGETDIQLVMVRGNPLIRICTVNGHTTHYTPSDFLPRLEDFTTKVRLLGRTLARTTVG